MGTVLSLSCPALHQAPSHQGTRSRGNYDPATPFQLLASAHPSAGLKTPQRRQREPREWPVTRWVQEHGQHSGRGGELGHSDYTMMLEP